jgi:hypothetical protein
LLAGTRIPATLCDTRAGEELLRAVERHRQATPSARPAQAEELRSALATVADPVSIARELRPTDPVAAMAVLRLVRKDDPAWIAAALLGADIATDRDDAETTLRYLGAAVEAAPHRPELRDRRYQVARQLFESLSPGRRREELGQLIIDDIALLLPATPDDDDDTELRRRAAEVHLRCGRPAAAARELFAVLQRDPGYLDSLLLYCRCWVELGEFPNAMRTGTEARHRIGRMADAQLLTPGEAQQWYERFAKLLP